MYILTYNSWDNRLHSTDFVVSKGLLFSVTESFQVLICSEWSYKVLYLFFTLYDNVFRF